MVLRGWALLLIKLLLLHLQLLLLSTQLFQHSLPFHLSFVWVRATFLIVLMSKTVLVHLLLRLLPRLLSRSKWILSILPQSSIILLLLFLHLNVLRGSKGLSYKLILSILSEASIILILFNLSFSTVEVVRLRKR